MRAKSSIVLLTAALLLAAAAPSRAQLDNLLTGYSLTSWNEGDGHPLGSVYAMVQDPQGYLWLGTDAGLFRFDGSRFTAWNTMSDQPLPAVAVVALCVTSRGSLLVGLAEGAGIREIRNGTLTELTRKGVRVSDAVTELVEGRDGTLWMVTGRELYTLRGEEWQKVELPWAFREGTVTQPIVTRTGDLLVGTRWGVFRRTPRATFELVSNDYVWGIHEDAAGTIWTTDIVAGFRRLGAPAPPRHPLEGAGYRLTHDRRGNLWIATFGEGLWRVRDAGRAEGPLIERANLRTGLSSDSVQSVLEDRDGNIWVGTTGGLHRLQERALTPVENVGFVVAMEPAEGARMWAGTTNGMIQFSGAPGPWARMGARSPGPDVRSLHRDKSGTLWIGASDGLWQFANGRLTHVALPGTPQMVVMEIASDSRGGLWLGDDEWLFHWDGSRLEPFPGRSDEGELQRITLARSDGSGRIWLGFSGGRLGYVDHDRALHVLGPPEGMTGVHATIHAVYEGADKTIWIGGSGGLSRFQHGRVATLTQANGLPAGRVWAVVEDLQGRMWLNMERGLVRLERGELEQAFADAAHRIKYRFYDTYDGLAGASVGIIGSSRGGDGTLWFVRGGGVTVVDNPALDDGRGEAPLSLRIEDVVANDWPHRARLADQPAGRHDAGPDPLHRAVALVLGSHPLPLPARRHRHGLGRRRHQADGVLHQPVAADPIASRSRPAARTASWQAAPVAWSFSVEPAFYQTRWFSAIGRGGRTAGGLGRVARPAAPGPAAVLAGARRARAAEPRDPRHAAPEPGRRRAAVRRRRREPRTRPRPRRSEQLRPRPPAGRGLHPRRAPVDLRSALAAARGQRPGDGAAGVRQAVASATRASGSCRGRSGRRSRTLAKIENAAAAHRAGSDHQRRPACGARRRSRSSCEFDDAAVTLRVSDDGHGFDVSCPDAEPRQALRADDDARARRRAGRPAHAIVSTARSGHRRSKRSCRPS